MKEKKGEGKQLPDDIPNARDEYHELSEDWRNRDQLIWVTITIVVAIGSATVGLVYSEIQDSVVRITVLLIAFVWILAMIQALTKHRLFQEETGNLLAKIEASHQMFRKYISKEKYEKRSWMQRRSAYATIIYATCFVAILVLFLMFYEGFRLLNG